MPHTYSTQEFCILACNFCRATSTNEKFLFKKSRYLIDCHNFCPWKFCFVGKMVGLGLFSCLLVVCSFARYSVHAYVCFFLIIIGKIFMGASDFFLFVFVCFFIKLEQNQFCLHFVALFMLSFLPCCFCCRALFLLLMFFFC